MNEGQSNKNNINVLNPDEAPFVLKGRDWVNPNEPDYAVKNKTQIKTAIQVNKEAVTKKKQNKVVEGKVISRFKLTCLCFR